MRSSNFLLVASTALSALASAFPMPDRAERDLHTIHQFPNLTWIENMAIRSNGQILATDPAGSRIYLVDPLTPEASPPVIAQFSSKTAILGIAEVQDDIFYVQGTNNSDLYNFQFPPNSSSVWEVDMRTYSATGEPAAVRKVVDIPAVQSPNGMALLSKIDRTILIADCGAGLVWRLNVKTGAYDIVYDDPLLKPIAGSKPAFGVNGVHVVGSKLYFSNFNQGLVAAVPITPDGRPSGPAVVISRDVPHADDFAVDAHGSIWLTRNIDNTLVRISPEGHVRIVAGGVNSTALAGPVAATFGRTTADRHVLYVSTDGLLLSSSGAVLTTDGKIAALDIEEC